MESKQLAKGGKWSGVQKERGGAKGEATPAAEAAC